MEEGSQKCYANARALVLGLKIRVLNVKLETSFKETLHDFIVKRFIRNSTAMMGRYW